MGKWSREATSLLIEEVKKLPFIYDPNHKRYHDRRARKAAMHNIANLLSDIRPETTSEEVRIRWSALRSAFQGSISKMKRQMNGTLGAEITKVWYFDDMLFLCDVRPSKNIFYYASSEGAETLDVSTQNEDIHHSVAAMEETMDGSPDVDIVSEAVPLENCIRNATEKNLQRESLQRENLQRENLQREIIQMESLQRENFLRESLSRENLQRDSLEQENLQRGTFQREDHFITDAPTDRGSSGDSRGSRRKRNNGISFGHTLEFAMKKLSDRYTEDGDFVFGKLVAHELKSLNSPSLKKKLKHKILLDIIEIQNKQGSI